jgi:Transposase DDE domain
VIPARECRARIVHRFGRTDQVDREALARLVRSISRFLDPADAVAAGSGGDGESVKPLSKLAGCDRVAERAYIDGLAELSDDACYRAMDFLHAALPALQERVFFNVASLLDLEVEMLLFDTSSTYWQTDRLPEELQDDDDRENGDVAPDDGEDGNGGQDDGTLLERGRRAYSAHSKDHRRDLLQVVVGTAVTRQGIPVRVWTFPGNASDQVIIRKVRDDLRGWNLSRVIWVLDRGFTSEQNRRALQRAGGHYIVGEKLRSGSHEAKAALSRQGRYHEVDGGLRVKQVRVDDGTNRDRFVIAHNPERAVRDQVVREQILARLRLEIAAADKLTATKQAELYGALSTKPAFHRFLRKTKTGKLRIDRGAVDREPKLDGKYLLRTSDESLSAEDIALGYKALYEAERGWRDLKSTIDMRPVYHRRDDRIESHVQLCWLALLLLPRTGTETQDTWRNLRNELDRMHLVTLATSAGTVSQRTELTHRQRQILNALDLPEPARFHDFTPLADPAE